MTNGRDMGTDAQLAAMKSWDGLEQGVVVKPQNCGKTEMSRQAAGQIAEAMTPPDGIPDRLCIERNSRFNSPAVDYIAVRIDGQERDSDVVEYCISEGWARIGVKGPDGRILRQPGRVYDLQTNRLSGVKVEPYWKSPPPRNVRRALARGR